MSLFRNETIAVIISRRSAGDKVTALFFQHVAYVVLCAYSALLSARDVLGGSFHHATQRPYPVFPGGPRRGHAAAGQTGTPKGKAVGISNRGISLSA